MPANLRAGLAIDVLKKQAFERVLLDESEKISAKLDALSGQSAMGTLPTGKLIEFLAYDLVDHHALGADRDFIPWLRRGPRDPAPLDD